MAPDDVTQNLIAQWFNSHADADGFLIEGYPRTMSQLGDYKRLVMLIIMFHSPYSIHASIINCVNVMNERIMVSICPDR